MPASTSDVQVGAHGAPHREDRRSVLNTNFHHCSKMLPKNPDTGDDQSSGEIAESSYLMFLGIEKDANDFCLRCLGASRPKTMSDGSIKGWHKILEKHHDGPAFACQWGNCLPDRGLVIQAKDRGICV